MAKAMKPSGSGKPVAKAAKPAPDRPKSKALLATSRAPVKTALPKVKPVALAKPAAKSSAKPVSKPVVKAKAKPSAKPQPAKPVVDGAYHLEDQVGFRLRRAHQRASVIFNDVMGRFDVTPTQFAALVKLHDLGPVSQNQLGRLTAMDPATILGVVGRLVRQNLARARPAPEDQRLMIIELTLEGRAHVDTMKAVAAEVSRRTLAPLSPAEARALNDLLARLG